MVRVALVYIFLASLNCLAVDMPNIAIKEYQLGHKEKAISILKEITSNSVQFKRSLETLAKIYYRDENWSQLFGVTLFYRVHFKAIEAESFDLISLEVLGLARNCQYELAQELINKIKFKYPKNNNVLALQKNYEIVKEYGFKEDVNVNKRRSEEQDSVLEFWRIDKELFLKLSDPYRLQVKVENKCIK